MSSNKIMVYAGVTTLMQSVGQLTYCSLCLAQYFCVIDFLRELPILIYIKILYFHNPKFCGSIINIGQSIESIANQALVLISNEPLTVFRTFIINSTSLGISAIWILTSVILIMGGARNSESKHSRWPWVLTSVTACAVDLVAVVIYANDSFYTRKLSDMMELIGGQTSGTGGVDPNTSWASWIMVIISSRFLLLFIVNCILIIAVITDCNAKLRPVNIGTQIEAPTMADAYTNDQDSDVVSTVSETRPFAMLPRPGLSRSFRRMKEFLFSKTAASLQKSVSDQDSFKTTPERSPRVPHVEIDKKRTVNFPDNLLSLPQRLENLIAEQQRRLDHAVIDTAGRNSPPRTSQSMPQLPSTHLDSKGRRGTAAELQGQLPWAYIPAPEQRMRDHLPPDEELPPVPLPDYTAIQPFRKASVHRAASSLSSLIQKREALAQSRPTITQSDVLY